MHLLTVGGERLGASGGAAGVGAHRKGRLLSILRNIPGFLSFFVSFLVSLFVILILPFVYLLVAVASFRGEEVRDMREATGESRLVFSSRRLNARGDRSCGSCGGEGFAGFLGEGILEGGDEGPGLEMMIRGDDGEIA